MLFTDLDTAPDWGPWEDEDTHHYLIRVLSQAVWETGTVVDRCGANLRDQLWRAADWMLNTVYPQMEPVEIDLADVHASPEDPT